MNIAPEIKTKSAIHQKKDQKQEYKLIGSLLLKRGLKLWSYNQTTGELKPAEIVRKVMIGYNGKEKKSNKVQFSPDCLYLQALNRKNAIKKINKYYAYMQNKNR